MDIYKKIKEEFQNTPDLVTKKIKISLFRSIYVIFLETVSSSNKVNNYVLKNIIIALSNNKKITNIENYLAAPVTKKIDNYDKVEFYLTNGFTIVIDGNNLYALETKADINRTVEKPDVQTSLFGPKDSFTENYQINVGLLKRRIKSNTIKIENLVIGRKTKTNVGIISIDDITDKKLVQKIITKLEKIDIDGIIDSADIMHLLDGEGRTVFPTIFRTERPDDVAKALLEGKIAIIVDTSPYALIMPSFLIDYINPGIDNYNKSVNINFLKIARILGFFITVMAPSIYIALINYNQEAIPTKLLINFAVQREGVPFPALIEAIIMLIICELLRESDLRFPTNYGSAISILGALIIGEAAVNAGIVSPIMIIVIALTFICSLLYSEVDMVNAIRHYRFIFLIIASIYGLYGIVLAFFFLLIKLASTHSLTKSYLFPIAPFDKPYFFKRVFKESEKKQNRRSKYLVSNNIIRKKEN